MPEGANVEIAHHLHEHGDHDRHGSGPKSKPERALEIGEAILLAMVAIATAWSGYESARWNGRSAERYAEASKYRVEQDLAATQAGQELLFNTNTLNAWHLATTTDDREAASLFERRFTDNYQVAFDAWLELKPLRNPDAPPGPSSCGAVPHRDVTAPAVIGPARKLATGGMSGMDESDADTREHDEGACQDLAR